MGRQTFGEEMKVAQVLERIEETSQNLGRLV
jgi:hypothetical protein